MSEKENQTISFVAHKASALRAAGQDNHIQSGEPLVQTFTGIGEILCPLFLCPKHGIIQPSRGDSSISRITVSKTVDFRASRNPLAKPKNQIQGRQKTPSTVSVGGAYFFAQKLHERCTFGSFWNRLETLKIKA